jgi:hypothetical protein
LPQSRARTDISLGLIAAYAGALAYVSALTFTTLILVDYILDAAGYL